jgi:hypothetical protein
MQKQRMEKRIPARCIASQFGFRLFLPGSFGSTEGDGGRIEQVLLLEPDWIERRVSNVRTLAPPPHAEPR